MLALNQIKEPIKKLRWRVRRAAAARRWGVAELARMPVVIGNAMPKSGSHLIIQILLGLTQIGPFVDPGQTPLTRSAGNNNLPDADVLSRLRELQSGDIAYAYLHAREPYIAELNPPNVAAFFVFRDPRDIVVSQIFYAMDIHMQHGMHEYYVNELQTMEQRIDAAIRGVQTPLTQLSSIRAKFDHYLGWLAQPNVCSLRFEDLVLDRQSALTAILDHLAAHGFSPQPPRPQALAALESVIAPRASGTFRKGQPGEWKQHFTESNKQTFKSSTGDLLQVLGYEKDARW